MFDHPIQILMILGIVLKDGPFCYWGSPPSPEDEMVPGIETTRCSWEIGTFLNHICFYL